jgi:hypothetical protein
MTASQHRGYCHDAQINNACTTQITQCEWPCKRSLATLYPEHSSQYARRCAMMWWAKCTATHLLDPNPKPCLSLLQNRGTHEQPNHLLLWPIKSLLGDVWFCSPTFWVLLEKLDRCWDAPSGCNLDTGTVEFGWLCAIWSPKLLSLKPAVQDADLGRKDRGA